MFVGRLLESSIRQQRDSLLDTASCTVLVPSVLMKEASNKGMRSASFPPHNTYYVGTYFRVLRTDQR